MSGYPPFPDDPSAVACPKDGGRDVHRAYHEADGCILGCPVRWEHGPEHLLWACRSCGHQWVTGVCGPDRPSLPDRIEALLLAEPSVIGRARVSRAEARRIALALAGGLGR